jgi:hypothetical protein
MGTDKQQTAVEWLLEELYDFIIWNDKAKYVLKQAKTMEKDQIIEAVNSQRQLGWDEKGEQYYNETYKK